MQGYFLPFHPIGIFQKSSGAACYSTPYNSPCPQEKRKPQHSPVVLTLFQDRIQCLLPTSLSASKIISASLSLSPHSLSPFTLSRVSSLFQDNQETSESQRPSPPLSPPPPRLVASKANHSTSRRVSSLLRLLSLAANGGGALLQQLGSGRRRASGLPPPPLPAADAGQRPLRRVPASAAAAGAASCTEPCQRVALPGSSCWWRAGRRRAPQGLVSRAASRAASSANTAATSAPEAAAATAGGGGTGGGASSCASRSSFCSGEGAAERAAGARRRAKIQETEEPGEEGGSPRSGGRLVVGRVGLAQVRPEAHQGLSLPKGILPLQQLEGVRRAEAGGAVPHGPQHLHPHVHRRAQPRRADAPQLARRHHPAQALVHSVAAAAVRRGGLQRVPASAADEPEPTVHARRALAHDAAAHAVHGGGRGRAARGGHGDGRRGRAPVPQRRRLLRGADGAGVVSLRRRRRAIPRLPVGHCCHCRLAGGRRSRCRELTE